MELKQTYIESTDKAPHVDLNHNNGELIISGKSIPENAALIYDPVLKWVHEYVKSPKKTTNLRLNLEYFNTSSAIWLAKIIQALCTIKNRENTVLIHVYFSIEDFDNLNDDDMLDELYPLINLIGTHTINVGIKIYGSDEDGEILKESMVFV